MAADKHQRHIFLIPGFFGFSDIGGITYFHHVKKHLQKLCQDSGQAPHIVEVATHPTASIRTRAAKLYQSIVEHANDEGPIHIIGHSTGGLDARLLVTPKAALGIDELALESTVKRVESIVSVATPHYGTPIASFFTSMFGAQLLYVFSIATVYMMNSGKLPMSALLLLGRLLTKADNLLGFDNTALDYLYERLFSDFDEDKQSQVAMFLDQIKSDQSLLGQLGPGALDLFNASTGNREHIRYASVVMQSQKPGWQAMRKIGLDPYRQASHTMYRILYRLVGDSSIAYPAPTIEQQSRLTKAFGRLPSAKDSDGVVPTLSQLWEQCIHAAQGDHLDVCGHFNDATQDPPHYDWIATGSNFSRVDFESLWGDVFAFINEPEH